MAQAWAILRERIERFSILQNETSWSDWWDLSGRRWKFTFDLWRAKNLERATLSRSQNIFLNLFSRFFFKTLSIRDNSCDSCSRNIELWHLWHQKKWKERKESWSPCTPYTKKRLEKKEKPNGYAFFHVISLWLLRSITVREGVPYTTAPVYEVRIRTYERVKPVKGVEVRGKRVEVRG